MVNISAGPNTGHRGSMLRWSMLAVVMAAVILAQGATALPHHAIGLHKHVARGESQSSSSAMSQPSMESKPRIGLVNGGKLVLDASKNSSKENRTVEELQKKIQQEIEKESAGGKLDINLNDILGKIGAHLKVEGDLHKSDNKTTVTDN